MSAKELAKEMALASKNSAGQDEGDRCSGLFQCMKLVELSTIGLDDKVKR